MDTQFYPTPEALAEKMWAKFEPRFENGYVLEPSAGDGALLKPRFTEQGSRQHQRRLRDVDVIEIDEARRALLDDRFNVVGSDFLSFAAIEKYSRIIMNPPFNVGVEHVLHAWDGLLEGQVVALVNAETIRNPFSAQRKRLGKLLQSYGNVEYVQAAFVDAERQTDVEVAILSLVKENGRDAQFAQVKAWLLNPQDDDEAQYSPPELNGTEVANLSRYVEEQVATFQNTVNLIKKMSHLNAMRCQMLARLGETFDKKYGEETKPSDRTAKPVAVMDKTVAEEIADARERAWLSVMDSTGVQKIASYKMSEQIHASLKDFVKVPFTVEKVHTFLESVLQSAPDLLNGVLDAGFDAFARYWSVDNGVFYRSWKSNAKHRAFGMKLKTTRFIVPNVMSYRNRGAEQSVGEFVRAMHYLDTGDLPALGSVGLADVSKLTEAIRQPGSRQAGVYADYRYFAGTQTLHVFPRRKDLVEKLNLNVARRRQWLPADDTMEHCWKAGYDAAEHAERDIAKFRPSWGAHPTQSNDPEAVDRIAAKVDAYYVEKGIWKSLPLSPMSDTGTAANASSLPMLALAA